MKKPRRIEYEFSELNESETYHYWEQYAIALEKYIDYIEKRHKDNSRKDPWDDLGNTLSKMAIS